MNKKSQKQQVIDAIRQNGGYATFTKLNQIVDVSQWASKTPFASIRRIVQQNNEFFRIQPGMWALTENKEHVLNLLEIKPGNKRSEDIFTHTYYQGIIVEIGKHKGFQTYIPAQDKNQKAIANVVLSDLAMTTQIPPFSYPEITQRAKSVDVIWFNDRNMPDTFFEVEHKTDIKNSLLKFMDLRDFYASFIIVANKVREPQYQDVLSRPSFAELRKNNRVRFVPYDKVDGQYASLAMQVI